MAIRVGSGKPAVPPAEPEVPEMPEALMEQEEAVSQPTVMGADMKFSADKLDPGVVRYLTSDMGPFVCANCEHYTANGDCEVVSGPIDPEGVCIVFTPGGSDDAEAFEEPVEEPAEVEPEEPIEEVNE